MASVIRGSDGFDSSDNATQTELDAAAYTDSDAISAVIGSKSLSGNGYMVIDGLKICWVTTGTTTATSGTTGFSWPSAFTTIYGSTVSQTYASDSGEIGVQQTTSGGTVNFYGWSSTSKQWTIIGVGV